MAINYAEKYSPVVDEKFHLLSVTDRAVNNNYDFIGVKTVNVYNVATVALGDYTISGTSRYGTPSELSDTVQEMTLSQDRAFTFTIDRMNFEGTQMTKEAGRCLAREIEEQVVPEIDIYRLAAMVTGAGTSAADAAPTKANAYELFLKGTEVLGDNKVPAVGRIAFVSYAFFNLLKQDSSFVKQSDMSQEMLTKGVLGMIDGVAIVPVPTSYLPTNKYMVLTHQSAVVSPMKLTEYKIHDNPPGINGWLVEGRIVYDAFVLSQKKMAIYVQGKAAA